MLRKSKRNFLQHNQVYMGQCGHGRGWNGRGGRSYFNSNGRGFTPATHYNDIITQ